jgi:iron complex outermembrane receptor protein
MRLNTSLGYDGYDRFTDIDLDFSPNELFEATTDDDGWQVALGVQLTGDIYDVAPIRWDIGGFYLYEELNVQIENHLGFIDLGVAERVYTQTLSSYGIYAQIAWDFWENFTLEGGARYNNDQKTIDYFLDRKFNAVTDFQEREWDAPTGFVRLMWRFRENTYAYWKYTRGYKGGHFNATSSLIRGVTDAEPESNDAFEVGLEGAWFDGKLFGSANFFYYNYDNYQLFLIQNDFGAQPEFVVLNASDVEVYGAEADVTYRPWIGSFLKLRFGWLESQFLDFVLDQIITRTIGTDQVVLNRKLNYTGNTLLNSPPFTVTLTAEQTIQLGRYGSLTGRYDTNWTDDVFFDQTEGQGDPNRDNIIFLPESTIGQQSYWLHNLTVIYRPPGLNIEIVGWVRNLSDEVYRNFSFNASEFQGTTIHFVGDPRTAGVTIDLSF